MKLKPIENLLAEANSRAQSAELVASAVTLLAVHHGVSNEQIAASLEALIKTLPMLDDDDARSHARVRLRLEAWREQIDRSEAPRH